VDGLGVLRKVVPEDGRVIGVGKMSGGVTLLCVDEVGELGGISQEEDGGVVGNDIPVALVSAELDGESTRVSRTVVGARLATDSGESDSDGTLLAGLENVGKTKVLEGVGSLVVSVGTTSLGVYNTLGDALTIKVREQIDQVEVLEEERTVLTNALHFVRVRLGSAI